MPYTQSVATNVPPNLQMNFTHTILRFLQVYVIQNLQIICPSLLYFVRNPEYVGKKLIPTKQLSTYFTMSSVLEYHCENTRSNHSEVFLLSVFLQRQQILEKKLWSPFLVKLQIESLELY